MILLAVIDATGRVRVVAAPEQTIGTAYESSDLLLVVPVAAQRLRVGDVIVVKNENEHALFRLDRILDSAGPEVHFAGDPTTRVRKLGGTTWRVRTAVPMLGIPMRLLAGPLQALVLVGLGFLLIVRAEVKRARESARAVATTGSSAVSSGP
jgi:hypothetical protein